MDVLTDYLQGNDILCGRGFASWLVYGIICIHVIVHEKLSALPSAEIAELRGALQTLRDEQLKDQALKIIRRLP